MGIWKFETGMLCEKSRLKVLPLSDNGKWRRNKVRPWGKHQDFKTGSKNIES